jgi:hypothetical protein
MFWHEPSKETGLARISTLHNGHLWLVRKHSDWFKETRMKKEMVRISLRRLKERGLVLYELIGKKGQEIPYVRVNWAEFERRMKLWMLVDSTNVEEETYQRLTDRCQYDDGAITPLVSWLPHHEKYAHLFMKETDAVIDTPVCDTPPPVQYTGDDVLYTPPPVCDTPSQAQKDVHIESLESIDYLEQIPRAGAHEGDEISVVEEIPEPPKPTMEDWERAITTVWPSSGEKYWRNILNMLWGRSKKGEWAEWNFEENMIPKRPAEILAFRRYMLTEEDETGELKYEKMRFPEKAEAIYKYWGFFRASKRFDKLVQIGERQMQLASLQSQPAEQAPVVTPPVEVPATTQAAAVEGTPETTRLTLKDAVEILRPTMHANTIIRQKASGQ